MAWHVAAKVENVPENEVIGVVVDGEPVAIYKLGGVLYATANVCTHEYALLSDGYIEGDCIECPLHQARFHIASGEVRAAPASARRSVTDRARNRRCHSASRTVARSRW